MCRIRQILLAGADWTHFEHLFQEAPYLQNILEEYRTLSRVDFYSLFKRDYEKFQELKQQERDQQQKQKRLEDEKLEEMRRLSHEDMQDDMQKFAQSEGLSFTRRGYNSSNEFVSSQSSWDQHYIMNDEQALPNQPTSAMTCAVSSSSASDEQQLAQKLAGISLDNQPALSNQPMPAMTCAASSSSTAPSFDHQFGSVSLNGQQGAGSIKVPAYRGPVPVGQMFAKPPVHPGIPTAQTRASTLIRKDANPALGLSVKAKPFSPGGTPKKIGNLVG